MIYGQDIPFYLTLYITLRSKFPCPFSPFEVSPESIESMAIEDARTHIDNAIKAHLITWIDISGGEPFLFYDAITEITSYGKQKGISGKVTTSGFWASETGKAEMIAGKLMESGVERLELRYDAMYEENVPLEKIKNAAGAARQKGLLVHVISSYLNPVSEDWAGKGAFEGETSNEYDSRTKSIQQELLGFLPKRCISWERFLVSSGNDFYQKVLGNRYEEAQLISHRALIKAGNTGGKIDNAIMVSILPSGEVYINGRNTGNTRKKELELMIRDFIIESRMAF